MCRSLKTRGLSPRQAGKSSAASPALAQPANALISATALLAASTSPVAVWSGSTFDASEPAGAAVRQQSRHTAENRRRRASAKDGAHSDRASRDGRRFSKRRRLPPTSGGLFVARLSLAETPIVSALPSDAKTPRLYIQGRGVRLRRRTVSSSNPIHEIWRAHGAAWPTMQIAMRFRRRL